MNIIKNYNENELTMAIEGRIDTITSEDLKKEIDEEIWNKRIEKFNLINE